MNVGIDSMTLIYAGIVLSKSKTASPELCELRVRAKLLLHQLAEAKATVILPTVAVAELLVPVPKPQMGVLIATLQDRFFCPSFDMQASAIAADLWARHKNLPKDQQYENRHVLKADTMIVASAKAAGATEFYSHDKNCRALAGLVMTPHDLPTRGADLFIEADIRRGEA